MKKIISLLVLTALLITVTACSKVDKDYGVTSEKELASDVDPVNDENLPEIMSLDQKMSNYFDTSLFDEENYSNIYLGRKFKIDAKYDGCDIIVPQKMQKLIENGWQLVEGSEYDKNSLIFAKETVSLNFINQNGAKLSALFYNASNSSVKLLKCQIVKFKIENGYHQNPNDYKTFNINNITNTTSVTDIINVLGTPSHFYQVTEENYYFDYFLTSSDRRNKIRIYVNIVEDSINAIEFSNYK